MIKPFILGSAIAVLSTLPALATDWKVTGVSNRTRETIAIDVDSIDRVSRYDVQFRYLISKELVQASVKCDSSLVTPNIGKPFVPDPTGATREMNKIACQYSPVPVVEVERDHCLEARTSMGETVARYLDTPSDYRFSLSLQRQTIDILAMAIERYCH